MFRQIAENCNESFMRAYSKDELFFTDGNYQGFMADAEVENGFMDNCLIHKKSMKPNMEALNPFGHL